jgi:ribosome-associated protein
MALPVCPPLWYNVLEWITLLSLRRDALDAKALARQIVDWLADKQAEDIILLDVHEVSILADYFVLCSGTSERQLDALTEEVRQQAKEAGARLLHLEGEPHTGWILLDYGDVVVHIFSPELRAYYRLEELWQDSNVLVRMA